MSIEKHIEEFLIALNGGEGRLDAWLECNNEEDCKIAIFGAITAEREACAEVCESMGALEAMNGEDEGSAAMVRVADRQADLCAAAIRARSNAGVTGLPERSVGESELT